MASTYFFSTLSQLFNGVLIIEKDYRGAELEISLIWNLMTQFRSQVEQETWVLRCFEGKDVLLVQKSIK